MAMWGDFGERTVILWADTEQHIKVRIIEVDMLTVYFKEDRRNPVYCSCSTNTPLPLIFYFMLLFG